MIQVSGLAAIGAVLLLGTFCLLTCPRTTACISILCLFMSSADVGSWVGLSVFDGPAESANLVVLLLTMMIWVWVIPAIVLDLTSARTGFRTLVGLLM
jgi:hypothetical protein